LFSKIKTSKKIIKIQGGFMFYKSLMFIMLLFATAAFAQGIYLGAGIGNTFFSSEIDDALDQAKEIDENSTAWKIFAGYHITDFLNVEGGYRSFGTISSEFTSSIYEAKTAGWDVEAVGRIQIAIIDLFAKAGAMFSTTDVTFLGYSQSDSSTDFLYGLGVGLHLGPIGARLEWESIAVSGPTNLSMVSLSATIGF
jgi:hypothetical protein